MRSATLCLGTAALIFVFSGSASARDDGKDHQHHHPSAEKLGLIEFPISCAKEVQAPIARAIALLHSFWYDEEEKAFTAVAAKAPSCAMAHWGVAMSLYHPLWAPPTPAEMERGRAAVARAQALDAKTAREKDYVTAISAYFAGPETDPP